MQPDCEGDQAYFTSSEVIKLEWRHASFDMVGMVGIVGMVGMFGAVCGL